jgi:hypothetical protein
MWISFCGQMVDAYVRDMFDEGDYADFLISICAGLLQSRGHRVSQAFVGVGFGLFSDFSNMKSCGLTDATQ